MKTEKDFPRGFESWLETHTEISMIIGSKLEANCLTDKMLVIQASFGHCGFWDLAIKLTDKFEEKYKGIKFGEDVDEKGSDFDFFDRIIKFLDEEL